MTNEVIFIIVLILALFGWFGFCNLYFSIKEARTDIKFLEEFHLKYIKDDIKRLEKRTEK